MAGPSALNSTMSSVEFKNPLSIVFYESAVGLWASATLAAAVVMIF